MAPFWRRYGRLWTAALCHWLKSSRDISSNA
eukprot:CAMPEP_0171430740 /NCGR_PEP_ID=MMETSP0881-20121228/6790_1 /TAXON_ID=67004 /ORGANISM="Thalassiosira weissflogii, Strain CCMP1336" /LENGTH=30 /DNA_ID= /DNA_START= /DNA_END= /DNA_ORIENTATION=